MHTQFLRGSWECKCMCKCVCVCVCILCWEEHIYVEATRVKHQITWRGDHSAAFSEYCSITDQCRVQQSARETEEGVSTADRWCNEAVNKTRLQQKCLLWLPSVPAEGVSWPTRTHTLIITLPSGLIECRITTHLFSLDYSTSVSGKSLLVTMETESEGNQSCNYRSRRTLQSSKRSSVFSPSVTGNGES